MEAKFQKGGDGEFCPQLLDLIPKERDWVVKDGGGGGGKGYGVAEEKQLELRLGPPNREEWTVAVAATKDGKEDPSGLSLGLFSKPSKTTTTIACAGAKRGFSDTIQAPDSCDYQKQQQKSHEKRAWPPAASPAIAADGGNATVAHNRTQPRTSATPVVGWPPVRSFRRNIASSSKSSPVSQTAVAEKPQQTKNFTKSLFVKIYMDGIPIGRKVDLKAYQSYESLASAVNELFRGLLAAQRECPSAIDSQQDSAEECPRITGLLDGSGEYTLVYEDSEGDKILAGDVPWEMFVSTVKRLRVLKTSELSTISLGSVKRAAQEPKVA